MRINVLRRTGEWEWLGDVDAYGKRWLQLESQGYPGVGMYRVHISSRWGLPADLKEVQTTKVGKPRRISQCSQLHTNVLIKTVCWRDDATTTWKLKSGSEATRVAEMRRNSSRGAGMKRGTFCAGAGGQQVAARSRTVDTKSRTCGKPSFEDVRKARRILPFGD